MSTFGVMAAIGLGSFLMRVGPLLALQRARLSARTDRLIRHAALAAVAALITGSARHAASSAPPMAVLSALALGAVLAVRGLSLLRIVLAGGSLYVALVIVARVVA
jgi:branched-subunit amino acid transport protein